MILGNILVHVDSKPPHGCAAFARRSRRGADGGAADGRVRGKGRPPHGRNGRDLAEPALYGGRGIGARGLRGGGRAARRSRGVHRPQSRQRPRDPHRFVEIARTFDLVILGQTQDDVPVPAKLPEQTILDSGRPVLVVPYVGTYADVGARPLFAWRSSRGAARAVSDALPLLAKDCEALIVEVARKNEQRDEFADLLVANLKTHGVAARYQHFVVDEIAVMDTLLSAVSDHAADLLAIGAFDQGTHALFGHGAGTRHILAHMTTPVLFSH